MTLTSWDLPSDRTHRVLVWDTPTRRRPHYRDPDHTTTWDLVEAAVLPLPCFNGGRRNYRGAVQQSKSYTSKASQQLTDTTYKPVITEVPTIEEGSEPRSQVKMSHPPTCKKSAEIANFFLYCIHGNNNTKDGRHGSTKGNCVCSRENGRLQC